MEQSVINVVAAVDTANGYANEQGIPWDLPSDEAMYRKLIRDGIVYMGAGTYATHAKPLNSRPNYVLSRSSDLVLRKGFVAVTDINQVTSRYSQNTTIWVVGGQAVFQEALPIANSLYLTVVDGAFQCSKQFPPFTLAFYEAESSQPQTENGLSFRFTRWERRP